MRTFKTTRNFAAKPEAVFSAFCVPERLARWWGPDGFSNTFESFEFKAGGVWRFTMHGPDESNYPNLMIFEFIETNRSVVMKHLSHPNFTLTIGIEPIDDGSKVTWEQSFDDDEVAALLKHIVEPANEQNLSRWQAEVGGNENSTGS